MHCLLATLEDDGIINNPVDKFDEVIENKKVICFSDGNRLTLVIEFKNEELDDIVSLYYDLESIIFFYFGFFPKVISLSIDNQEIDLSNRAPRFISSGISHWQSFKLCDISEKSINQKVFESYKKLNCFPIYSMQTLISKGYVHVLIDHKLILLLHVIEGFLENTNFLNFAISKGNDLCYKNKIELFCKKYFFRYHNNNDLQILDILNLSEEDFCQTLTDTRHWYSHFLKEHKKQKRLKDGNDMIYVFTILFLITRLNMLDFLGIDINDDGIISMFLHIQDWIIESKGLSATYHYRSNSYRFKEMLEKL